MTRTKNRKFQITFDPLFDGILISSKAAEQLINASHLIELPQSVWVSSQFISPINGLEFVFTFNDVEQQVGDGALFGSGEYNSTFVYSMFYTSRNEKLYTDQAEWIFGSSFFEYFCTRFDYENMVFGLSQ